MAKRKWKWLWGALGTIAVGVISGLIVEKTKGVPVFAPLARVLRAVVAWLRVGYSVERWWLWTISLTAIASLGLLIVRRWAATSSILDGATKVLSYTQDDFLGLKWSWSWGSGSTPQFDHHSLRAYCPRCTLLLRFRETVETRGYMEMKDVTMASCDDCNFSTTLDGDFHAVRDRVGRMVERKVRNEVLRVGPPE